MNLKIISAGGLIIKKESSGYFTILVGSGDPILWRIPKGMQIQGESIEETAIREVFEETGISGEIIDLVDIGKWTYKYDMKLWDETCYFFLMSYLKGYIENHDNEYEYVKWIDILSAKNLLSYDIEKNVVQKAIRFLIKKE